MEEEKHTYKYTATKGRMECSVSGMKYDAFLRSSVRLIRGQRLISFDDATWLQSV